MLRKCLLLIELWKPGVRAGGGQAGYCTEIWRVAANWAGDGLARRFNGEQGGTPMRSERWSRRAQLTPDPYLKAKARSLERYTEPGTLSRLPATA